MDVVNIFIKYNEKIIKENDIIIVGFSGGPDSVFLVEMLLKLREIIKFDIILAHVNHLFRGEDSDNDEFFSEDYARKNKLLFFSKRIDVQKIAKEKVKSFEEVGRDIRYSFFEEIKKKYKASTIATAHNKDDQIETFLFRLIRGTSLDGLEGIKSIESKNIIRPISEFYKEDILNYLDKNNIKYKIDRTNLENDYTRNSIRLDLIPFIEKRYNHRFKDKVYDIIQEIRETNLENKIDLNIYLNDDKIILKEIKNLSKLKKIKIFTAYLNKYHVEINREKLNNILKLLDTFGTKIIDIGSSFKLVKDYNFIYIDEIKEVYKDEVRLKIPFDIIFGKYRIIADTNLNSSKSKNIFRINLRYGDVITIRNRKNGDKMIPFGMKNYKKVKDIMINEKVNKLDRDKIPIFLHNDEIFWIYSVKKSNLFLNNNDNIIDILVEEV